MEKIFEKGSREAKLTSLLFHISETLSKSIHLKDVLGPVLQVMAEHMGMLRGTVTILNRQTDEIVIEEAFGLSSDQRARGKYRLGEGVTGKVVETGMTAIVPRISDDPLFLDKTGARKELEKKDIAFICVPIKVGREVAGTLSADRLFDENISLEEDVKLMSIIASMIAHSVKIRQMTREKMEKLEEENLRLQKELKEKFKPSHIIGSSKAMQEVYDLISKVVLSNTTVMIRGESGCGKERVAHAIHYNSFRSEYPFIKLNCAALPENLIESELFGHEKGAFTGALNMRKGKFELASSGTLFLDEIGDMPLSTQSKLLRVLQEKEFERLGGSKTLKTDARIITATNKNLEKMVEEGKFREDLYYRIQVFPIFIPPLRERKSDIILLAEHFIQKYSDKIQKPVFSLSGSAVDLLLAYHWPGNVREMENVIERAVLLSNGEILPAHLPLPLQKREENSEGSRLKTVLESIEKEMIEDALKETGGNQVKAALILGITERMMGLRVQKYKIEN
ncbi:MAG TPA: sigma-54-dependent Fis family transcriptional regulator [Spirochaetia bacterium]|nr:MAG: sigma-54-dependent Fis family transcriptional regulator [Spirochaetes bacterium GWB1_36_13]HCL56923.1 sigma-54-dependent Fis family transcriptional regulator [Spirochaetia bacterium]